jgi:hypothetical protein
MMMMICSTQTLSWTYLVLIYWKISPQVIMSLHSDTLFWFWAHLSLPSGKASNIKFVVFGSTRPTLEPMIYDTRGEHAKHYTAAAFVNIQDTNVITIKMFKYRNILHLLWACSRHEYRSLRVKHKQSIKWVNEWLMFNAKWEIFELHHSENMLHCFSLLSKQQNVPALL